MIFITIFPDMMREPLDAGVLGIARRKGAADYRVVNLRDFAEDKHGTVDDYPYGGGPGMILMAPPLVKAVESVCGDRRSETVSVIMLSPCGRLFSQSMAEEFAGKKKLVFICGRYKGIDERVGELTGSQMVSIGDYVLSGGELPSLVIADAVARYLPGVLGDERSRETDSFSGSGEFSLGAALYTRPPDYRGLKVPDVLISGDHARIENWRRESAEERTRLFRPDLISKNDNGPADTGCH